MTVCKLVVGQPVYDLELQKCTNSISILTKAVLIHSSVLLDISTHAADHSKKL